MEKFGRCIARYKVLKYSFLHDETCTPEGISSTAVDANRWTHRTDPSLFLRIEKCKTSSEKASLKIIVAKGYGSTGQVLVRTNNHFSF